MAKLNKIPHHVAIIMDGNGRWAQEQGKDRSYGHYHGFLNLKKLAKHIYKKGVKVLSVYAFSTENFNREEKEVSYLMNLFLDRFSSGFKDMERQGIKMIFSGAREYPLPDNVIKKMIEMEERTKSNSNGIFNICLNYGGHKEIVDATKKIVKDKLDYNIIDEKTFETYLYNEMPPIDLLIRTGKEKRISNFMLWQIAYSELYFTDIYFPNFDNKMFDECLIEYDNRERRFGTTKKV